VIALPSIQSRITARTADYPENRRAQCRPRTRARRKIRRQSGWDENRVFSRATSSRSRSTTDVGCWPASRRGTAGRRAGTALFRCRV